MVGEADRLERESPAAGKHEVLDDRQRNVAERRADEIPDRIRDGIDNLIGSCRISG
jgi:hypothetical protein